MDIRIFVPFMAGEPGCHQAFLERPRGRDANRAAVQARAASLFRGKHLISGGIVNYAGYALALVFERHGDAEYGIAVGKVGGAIERVNVPAKVAAGLTPAAFLAHQIVVRPLLADALDNQLL